MTIAPTASPAVSTHLIETALRAAAGATGMQLVFVSSIEAQTFTWRALHGELDGIAAGASLPLRRGLLRAPARRRSPVDGRCCARSGVLRRPAARRHWRSAPTSGVPLRQGGVVTGTLGGFDAGVVPVGAGQLERARGARPDGLGGGGARSRGPAAPHLRGLGGRGRVRRPRSTADDLTVAMSLADVIAGETRRSGAAAAPSAPGRRPVRGRAAARADQPARTRAERPGRHRAGHRRAGAAVRGRAARRVRPATQVGAQPRSAGARPRGQHRPVGARRDRRAAGRSR